MKSTALAIAMLFILSGVANAQQMSIQPSILDYHLAPGTTESQTITITNLSNKKMIFEASLTGKETPQVHIIIIEPIRYHAPAHVGYRLAKIL